MNSDLKVKIIGENPSSLILALALAKTNCEIYLDKSSKYSDAYSKDDIIIYSKNACQFFDKIYIWNKLKNSSNRFKSQSFYDCINSKEILFQSRDLDKDKIVSNNYGFFSNYLNFKRIFIDELNKHENIQFIPESNNSSNIRNFDLVFKFTKISQNKNKIYNLISRSKTNHTQKILSFNVYLRGNIEGRFYEINTKEGFIMFIPISKHIYQIKWCDNIYKTNERLILSKSLLLDNLTSILPIDFKIDQIIGDVYIDKNYIFTFPFYSSNSLIYFDKYIYKSCLINNLLLNITINDTKEIIRIIQKGNTKLIKRRIKFYLFKRRIIDLPISFLLPKLIINLIIGNNLIFIIIRKLLYSLNIINLFKKFVLKYVIY